MTDNPQQRKMFESWAAPLGYELQRTFDDPDGDYVEPDTRDAWAGYRGALSQPTIAPVELAIDTDLLRRAIELGANQSTMILKWRSNYVDELITGLLATNRPVLSDQPAVAGAVDEEAAYQSAMNWLRGRLQTSSSWTSREWFSAGYTAATRTASPSPQAGAVDEVEK